jgi:acetoacetyl-CoA synthetase
MFFFTTAGWMVWDFLVSSPLLGVCPVLYDGNPGHPDPGVLWQVADDAQVSLFGASPAYVDLMSRAGVVPGKTYDLSRLREVLLAGSPVSAACGAWFYRNVKPDLWLATGSGGTDVCTGFVGGMPTLPVYAGEIQAPHLGVAAHAFNERGEDVVGEVGEFVITQPMPSMPVGFWNDPDGARYRESYFDMYPGIWRHGDWIEILPDGGCIIYGRSDATLNRGGVRMGTSEFYRAVEAFAEVGDCLVVDTGRLGAEGRLILFVLPAEGAELDDDLRNRIRAALRAQLSPRHVPDEIHQVPGIPRTLSGKKLEVPVRKILHGTDPERAADPNALADPDVLRYFGRFQGASPAG